MRGNCQYQVFNMQNGKPFVCLSTDQAPAFWQGFDSHEEVDAFISKLQITALEAFGPKRITMEQLLKENHNDTGED